MQFNYANFLLTLQGFAFTNRWIFSWTIFHNKQFWNEKEILFDKDHDKLIKKINISSFILFFWLSIFVFKLSSNDFRVIKHVDNFFLDFYSLSCPEYHENPTSELQKKTGINAYIQRAAIIVKKKKKRCGFQLKKGSGFTWKGGSIRGSTDRSWLYRSEPKKRREESKGRKKDFSRKMRDGRAWKNL